MKKFLTVLLITALAVSMGACAKPKLPGTSTVTTPTVTTPSPSVKSPAVTSPSPGAATTSPGATTTSPGAATVTPGKATPTKTVMKDGTYDAKGDPWEKGQEEAKIVVKGGKISQVTLMRLDTTGKEVDYSLFNGKEHNGKVYPNLQEDRKTMAQKMIEKQSTSVDTISGATTSTKNWVVAAGRALAKAQKS